MLLFRLPDSQTFYTLESSQDIPVSFVSFDTKTVLDFKGSIKQISKETNLTEHTIRYYDRE